MVCLDLLVPLAHEETLVKKALLDHLALQDHPENLEKEDHPDLPDQLVSK